MKMGIYDGMNKTSKLSLYSQNMFCCVEEGLGRVRWDTQKSSIDE